ncbi:NADH:flavin oxidoreductase/NADH oxidase [Nitratireductor soli]|uniref:NADH:flavin oxidoreductase/NADH oxidase n=1 Tax=Nitratireductor soli TaxID=1670619 RepID=UPI0009E63A7E|nr:NADH:flavin oxidoreductase/NADH oxidase [Nitratireductor soli]
MGATLFSPLTVAGTTFPNRIVVSPMCQYRAIDGAASDWHMIHLGQFALSGAGLVMIEATGVEAAGRITPGCLGLYTDAQEEALARVLKVFRHVGKMPVGIQIGHAGRKASSHVPWDGGHGLAEGEGAWTIVAPSAVAYDEHRAVPEALDGEGMRRIVAAFVQAAERAERIGLDVVELHAAHGYLLHQFIAPLVNRRTDAYGGSRENRLRFPLEVAAALRAVWPEGKVLGARINGPDLLPGGATIEDTIAFADGLKKAGFDYVCVSAGSLIGGQRFEAFPGYLLPYAEAVKRETGLVTQGVGMIVDPFLAEQSIATGQVDMVAIARAFLEDPRWVWHAAEKLGIAMPFPPEYRGADPAIWRGAAHRPLLCSEPGTTAEAMRTASAAT